MNIIKNAGRKVLALVLAALLVMPLGAFAEEKDYGSAKNVIVMIPDGMSVETATFARFFTEDFKLNMDPMATGLVRTSNSNTPIADSAPAGTAMATGYKSESPYVASYPSKGGMPGAEDFDQSRANEPLATVLEAAKSKDMATGIVATANINHATPADYSAHHPNRSEYERLIEQQVYQEMDVVLGAGSGYLDPEERDDGQDLVAEVKNLGYEYVTTRDEMKAASSDKIWGMFAEWSMAYDLDRPAEEPSLAEMTEKALEVLSKDENGFFLMVEGSEIDWANHAHDIAGSVYDTLAFDEAVKVAKDFADKNGDTVIVIAADHGTGGLTVGNYLSDGKYDKIPVEEFTKYIKNAKASASGTVKMLNEDKSNIAEVMADLYNMTDLTAEEIQNIQNAEDTEMAIGDLVSNRSYVGWTTGGHVGGDVGLYCYSTDNNAKLLTGTVHNNEIGEYVADLLDVDLDALSAKLFVPVRKAAEDKGASVDFQMDEGRKIVVTLTKENQVIEIPVYKNYVLNKGEKVVLPGVTVFNGETTFVPQEVIDLID